ncbi:MAG: M28 family peptidase [Bacteroidota bacterium]
MMKINRFDYLPKAFLILSLLVFVDAGFGQHWIEEHARAVITPYQMQQSVNYLASDSLKGRETPGPGLDSAAGYIARQFAAYGIAPLKGTYFQDLQYCTFDLGSDLFLSVVKDLETINFELQKDFIPFEHTGSIPAEGDIVFAGYGITAPEYHYDDYQDIDVQGKIVAILRLEPGQSDSTQPLFKGLELTRYSGLVEKQNNARKHGAVGVLVISGPLNYKSLKPQGYNWPSLPGASAKIAPPMGYCNSERDNIPMVSVGESVIRELFGSADTLKRMQQHIEHDMQPHSFLIPGKTMAMNIVLTSTPVGGRNVIGYIKGSGQEKPGEAIIVGAHYDHIGYLREHKADSDYIFNGADDNASGTSGMLAVARAFASMPKPPERSVIFIAFAGEEKGLLGSGTYIRQPWWPLANTEAMINLDMISRNDPDSLEIIGARQNPDLVKIVRKQNKSIGFKLAESKDETLDAESDHYNFYIKGIPDIFFFTGLHQDYHKVSDNPGRINAEKASRVARLAFLTAWTIANEHKHYKIIMPKPGMAD